MRYRRVNEKTGEEVKWNQIVRGYQYEKGEYVALSDQDFAQANVDASQSIEKDRIWPQVAEAWKARIIVVGPGETVCT